MINYVIYGNTDYLDVLQIQTDYLKDIKNKILFINKNELNINLIYNEYIKVVFYDEANPYAKRLGECLNQIDDEYILLCHDIDIVFNVNQELIIEFYNFLKHNNFDRVDIKYTPTLDSTKIYKCQDKKNHKSWHIVDNIDNDDKLYLIKQTNPHDYIYNVNPSIWKRDAILEIVNKFPNKSYREIEGFDVQVFSTKFDIYKIYSEYMVECGHYKCINDFVFFHISHNGKFVPLVNYSTVYGQTYVNFKDEYEKIVKNYNLKSTNKWIN